MLAAHMRLDAHQHFWKYSPVEHSWMTPEMAALKRDHLPAELAPLLQSSGFDGCVAVQARQSLEETRSLLELAEEHDFIRGVVGWVDLRSAAVEEQLAEFALRSKFVGVRHVVQDEPEDDFLLRADFQDGISRLAEHGLSYDLLLYPKHLRAAVELVAKFSTQRFVLDHLAKPPIASGALSPWREEVRELARHENVSCKVSGLVTEALWSRWQQGDFVPYLDVVFEAFGTERLMIGSDWPVCTVSADYRSTIGIVTEYLTGFSEDEQAAILGENCRRIYALP